MDIGNAKDFKDTKLTSKIIKNAAKYGYYIIEEHVEFVINNILTSVEILRKVYSPDHDLHVYIADSFGNSIIRFNGSSNAIYFCESNRNIDVFPCVVIGNDGMMTRYDSNGHFVVLEAHDTLNKVCYLKTNNEMFAYRDRSAMMNLILIFFKTMQKWLSKDKNLDGVNLSDRFCAKIDTIYIDDSIIDKAQSTLFDSLSLFSSMTDHVDDNYHMMYNINRPFNEILQIAMDLHDIDFDNYRHVYDNDDAVFKSKKRSLSNPNMSRKLFVEFLDMFGLNAKMTIEK